MSNKVYPNGNVEVTIPATESIAIYSRTGAKVYEVTDYTAVPSTTTLLSTIADGTETVLGAYASGKTVVIEAGASEVLYEVGAAPRVLDYLNRDTYQGDPVAVNTTGAVSAAAILGGIVTSTTAAAVAGTIPTGTVMDAASEMAIGDSVQWSVINTGGTNAFTVTAATGHTIVGAAAVAASTSGLFLTRKTAANTYVTYRIG
ncbi:MAG: hypothetical protein EP341_00830 [Sphingomonadales bacterium]|nr:MAG: hypothetical protein EP341_00830 [Sphingomonadales bacterium]